VKQASGASDIDCTACIACTADAAIYSLDVYSTATLSIVVPVIAILSAPHAATNGWLIGMLFILAFVVNVVAMLWVLKTDDYHVYVTERRLLLWSKASFVGLLVMIVVAVIVTFLS